MRRFILSSALASALFVAAAPVLGQVYKWVDARGVVNYSNEPPANGKATQLDPKSSRVSIIVSDETQKQSMASPAGASERALADQIDGLERKLDAERYARSVSEAQAQATADSWYQRCARDRRVDCDYGGTDPYYYGPYYRPAVVARPHVRHRSVLNRPVAAPKPAGRSSLSSRAMAAPRQM